MTNIFKSQSVKYFIYRFLDLSLIGNLNQMYALFPEKGLLCSINQYKILQISKKFV